MPHPSSSTIVFLVRRARLTFMVALVLQVSGSGQVALAQASAPTPEICAPVCAPDGVWRWIQVEPTQGTRTGWGTWTGTASVRISGAHFHADLTVDPDKGGADITLDGTIVRNRFRAREILLNTDAKPAEVRGVFRREPYSSYFEERFAISGGQSGAASFLGLFRRVARP